MADTRSLFGVIDDYLLLIALPAMAYFLARAAFRSTRGRSFLVALAVAGMVFYVGWWETPAARCNRGDLGACIVYESQRSR